ncbi:hypothetical protein [Paenibacillus apiarius]|uniref:hypothetical protein n=1 Tax=Paenibacillus apiarius TaxID=46240 RepID=UPI00197D8B72|nr:hypothetical protein [Paenibacillus apiarius]MBN3523089.1 hypothetical protein [Paenibacillus apiarius]
MIKGRVQVCVTAIIAVSLFFTSLSLPISANAQGKHQTAEMTIADAQKLQELEQGLRMIEQIPDSVLAQGDEATREWIVEHYGYQPMGILGCVAAIGETLIGAAIPAAKVTKIKDAIKAAGGVKKVVEVMSGAFKAARDLGMSVGESIKWAVKDAFKLASEEVFSALLSFFGVAGIIDECFGG